MINIQSKISPHIDSYQLLNNDFTSNEIKLYIYNKLYVNSSMLVIRERMLQIESIIESIIINKTINDVIDNSKFDKLFNLINIRSIFNMGVSHG